MELPRDYPKVAPKVKVIRLEPDSPKTRQEVDSVIKANIKTHSGTECIHEVTGAVYDILNRSAWSRAEKVNPFSLEEERAEREAAATRAAIEAQAELQRQQQEAEAKKRRELASQLDSQRQKHVKTQANGTNKDMDVGDPMQLDFERQLTYRLPDSKESITFSTVDTRGVLRTADDKIIRVVAPILPSQRRDAPQLLLKEIILPHNLLEPDKMTITMRQVEQLLRDLCQYKHENVSDVIGYKLLYPREGVRSKYVLYVLTEYASLGSLEDLIEFSGTISSAAKVRETTRQILNALAFFETKGYIHPRLHMGNILIFKGKNKGDFVAKLSDGYGTTLRDLVDRAKSEGPWDSKLKASPNWFAPELDESLIPTTSATSVWELGVIILQMVFGPKVLEKYPSPQHCLLEEPMAPRFADFMARLFRQKHQERATASDLVAASFLAEGKSNLLKGPSATVNSEARASGTASRWDDEWERLKKLGKGAGGSVYKARKLADQNVYAVKIIELSQQEVDLYRKEVVDLARLQHPYIVRYFDSWTELEEAQVEESVFESSEEEEESDHLDRAPSTMGIHRSEAEALYNEIRDDRGRSIVSTRLRLADDLSSDDDEQPDTGSYDNDDDYDNAFGQGNAAIDSKELAVDLPARNVNRFDLKPKKSTNVQKGRLFIQMEFCEGMTLRSLILKPLANEPADLWRILHGILEGLDYIHQQGVAHRDLKPDNIFMGLGNAPKIGDFGLATATTSKSEPGSYVGTPLYIAPEIRRGQTGTDLRKADMYSLGVVLFEMATPFGSSFSERVAALHYIQNHGKLPEQYTKEPKNPKALDIVHKLLERDPAKRPSASELLESGDVPEPVEQIKLQRHLEHIVHEQPAQVAAMFKNMTNTDLQDLAWDDVDRKKLKPRPGPFLDDMRCRLRSVFNKHGAVESKRQALVPKTSYVATDAVIVFDRTAMNFQLNQDLTTPFARSIATLAPQYTKYYCFDPSYQLHSNTISSVEPKQTPEVNFDFVSHTAQDVALKEAMALCVAKEISTAFPALSDEKYRVILNHMDILDAILAHSGVKKSDYHKVKEVLEHLPHGSLSTKRRNAYLSAIERILNNSIASSSVAELMRWASIYQEVSGRSDEQSAKGLIKIDDLRKRLAEKNSKDSPALPAFDRLIAITKHLARLDPTMTVTITPLFSFRSHLYAGDVVFSYVETRTGLAVARGGRYDSLIAHHKRANPDPPIRAVGARVDLDELAQLIGHFSSTVAASQIPPPSRCSVLVTSFDADLLVTSCLDVLREVWAAGVGAELTEEMGSMADLEAAHAGDGPYWLVIVRRALSRKEGGAEVEVKVRSPVGEEKVVGLEEVGEWLRVEVARGKKERK